MDKTHPPTSFGIFKPVGHTVIAFHSEAQLQSAVMALQALGFVDASMVRYGPAEMAAQVDAELQSISPLAHFGSELDLIRAHRALALQGCSFLVVAAPSDALRQQVSELVHTLKPAAAQHYGQLLIEDLTAQAPGRMGDQ